MGDDCIGDHCSGDDSIDKDGGRDRLPISMERSVSFSRNEAGTLAAG
jgi:hypothetical protein